MNKTKALEFAKRFIKDVIFTKTNIDINKPFENVFNPKFLEDDPNFEILNQELNKVGYKIFKTENSTTWTVSKL